MAPPYALGYKPDSSHVKQINAIAGARSIGARLGTTATAAAIDLRTFLPPIMDQGQTGSCTGHSIASCAYGACAAVGKTLAFVPSPANLYTLERCVERAAAGAPDTKPLTDEGAMPADGLFVLQKIGIMPMQNPTPDGRYSDADPKTINQEPLLGDLEADSQTLTVTGHPITAKGLARSADVRAALTAGCPVALSVPGGSDAFQGYTSGVLDAIDLSENPLDHYVSLVAFATDTDGSVVFTLRNSWGTSWGENGYARVSEAFLEQSTDDLYALSAR